MKRLRVWIPAVLVVLCLFAQSQTFAQPPTGTGQIAIARTDGNLYLYDMSSGALTPITSDAISKEKIYSWPTWANDGQLAYFGADLTAKPPYQFGIFIQPLNGDANLVYSSPDETFTYASWSPGECPQGNCRDLTVLYTKADGGLALRQVRTGTGSAITELGEGSPFYWDWSPDGQSMIWSRSGKQLEIYGEAQGKVIQTLSITSGRAGTVSWSPVDGRLLFAADGKKNTSDLIILDGAHQTVLASGLTGIVSSEWSPDGTKVAYTDDDGGSLFVVDVATAQISAPVNAGVWAFFWSPDGTKIAYVILTDGASQGVAAKPVPQQSNVTFRWVVYDVAAGTSTLYGQFLPTRDMLYFLSFYDQFARSHRLWSPDSRYLVYAEMTPEAGSVISLQDTSQPGSAPTKISDGRIAVFSW